MDSGDAAGAEASYRAALRLAAALPETARAILTRDLAAALLAGNSAIKDREARDLLRPIAPGPAIHPAIGASARSPTAALARSAPPLWPMAKRRSAAGASKRPTIGRPRPPPTDRRHARTSARLDIENAARNQLETRQWPPWGRPTDDAFKTCFCQAVFLAQNLPMALGLGLAAAPAAADLSEADTDQLRAVVRAYLLENPEVIIEALEIHQACQEELQAAKAQANLVHLYGT